MVIALIIMPEGFPLAYEVSAGNTADNTTLRDFLARIERQYGESAANLAVRPRSPTEEVLQEMRASDPPVQYLVGTPKGRLTALERVLLEKAWIKAREDAREAIRAGSGAVRVCRESRSHRQGTGMRRRQLKWLWQRLKQLSTMKSLTRETLMKLGAAQSKAPAAWRLVSVELPVQGTAFDFWLNRRKLREARRREGRYLLRTNLTESDPAKLWEYYLRN